MSKSWVMRNLWAFICLAVCVAVVRTSSADTPGWLSPAAPEVTIIRQLGTAEAVPMGLDGNRNCQERKILIRPAKLLQSEIKQDDCVIQTAFGIKAQYTGYLGVAGANVFGPIKTSTGTAWGFTAIPRSPDGLRGSSAPGTGSVYLNLVRDIGGGMTTQRLNTGEVVHKLRAGIVQTPINDRSGRRLPFASSSLAFSANGQWMLADIPFLGTARVNLQTLEVLPFGIGFAYGNGSTPSTQLAVSSSGRYAVVSSGTNATIRLYDLSTCGAVPNTITAPVSCQYKDLLPTMQSQLPGYFVSSRLRFVGEGSIEVYAGQTIANTSVIKHIVVSAPGWSTTSRFEYLGLGDSFASGEGAFGYKPFTDTNQNKCHLSLKSYPYLIARELSLNTYESVACSGAKMIDIVDDSSDYNRDRSQAKGKFPETYNDEIFGGFLPGYRAQKIFANNHTPSVITVSVVGNDIGFSSKIIRCLSFDTCFRAYEERLSAAKEVNSKFYDLVGVYSQLKESAGPKAKIYAIGYPQIGDEAGNCAINVRLDSAELSFARMLISHLNQMIKNAAARAGVFYVDTEAALTGARLCEGPSHALAVNGLTAGNDEPGLLGGPFGKESYHPNTRGHQMLKASILAKTNNFTAPMPLPSSSASEPVISDTMDLLKNMPRNSQAVRKFQYLPSFAPDQTVRGEPLSANISAEDYSLAPGTNYEAWLTSTPTKLGDFVADSSGNLTVNSTIPASVEPGFHTLHIYGINSSGEAVDIFKTLFVAASATDADADGIIDSADSCPAVANLNQDIDVDGVDDVCDGEIGLPPPPVVVRSTPLSPPSNNSVAATPAAPTTVAATPVPTIVTMIVDLVSEIFTNIFATPVVNQATEQPAAEPGREPIQEVVAGTQTIAPIPAPVILADARANKTTKQPLLWTIGAITFTALTLGGMVALLVKPR